MVNIARIANRGRAPTVAEFTALLDDPKKAKELSDQYEKAAQKIRDLLTSLRAETTVAAKDLGRREEALTAEKNTHAAAVQAFNQKMAETEQRLNDTRDSLGRRENALAETEKKKAAAHEKREGEQEAQADSLAAYETTLAERLADIEAQDTALKAREDAVKAREDIMASREDAARAFLKEAS